MNQHICPLLDQLGFSFQKARFAWDHLNEAARAEWEQETANALDDYTDAIWQSAASLAVELGAEFRPEPEDAAVHFLAATQLLRRACERNYGIPVATGPRLAVAAVSPRRRQSATWSSRRCSDDPAHPRGHQRCDLDHARAWSSDRLRNVAVTMPNQVWCADITYIPLPLGFMYLVAIMDWYSRYVLGWRLSNTLDGQFCVDVLQETLAQNRPTLFNTDQGVQFTARRFTETLETAGVVISMDGRGRMFDNIFIERFWRSLKYEDIYIKEYTTVPALETGLAHYIQQYNYERPHQALAYATPAWSIPAARARVGKLWTTSNSEVDHSSPTSTARATRQHTGYRRTRPA